MITRNFILHLTAGLASPLVINVNQYDQGEQWLFTLYNQDGTQYVPSSGAIVGIKSDNLGIINSGTVDGQGRVVINETQQMTAAVGKAVFELLIDDQTHGTANFIVLVEPKPGDNADLSESDYSLFQQAIDGTSATAIAEGVADWMDENLTPTTPVVDASLTVQGAAADSAKVGQELSDLKSQINAMGGGVPTSVRYAIYTVLNGLGYLEQGYTDELTTIQSWSETVTALTISASSLSLTGNTPQTLTASTTPAGKPVTWESSNPMVATVNNGVVTGVRNGSCTITARCGDLTATCAVTVSGFTYIYHLENAVFTGNSSEVIDTGVTPLSVDRDFTIALDLTRGGTYTAGSYVFRCLDSSTQWGAELRLPTATYWANLLGEDYKLSNYSASYAGPLKVVIRHTAGATSCEIKLRTTGAVGTYTIGSSSGVINDNLYIGGNGYKDTINSFTWYAYRFTDGEVNTFLGVE